jgi:hypothetical protein
VEFPGHHANRIKAPFTLNDNVHFQLPAVNQTCDLFAKLFNDSIVLDTLTEILFRHHDAAWKFAATCKDAWRLMSWNIVCYSGFFTLILYLTNHHVFRTLGILPKAISTSVISLGQAKAHLKILLRVGL